MLGTSIAKADGLDLEVARHLIVESKPAEAYALLEPYEFEQAGNTEFDYLLGLAALNSGQAGKASLILERVLVADPLFAAARLDLGRAYYVLGDFERALAEFTHAQALNPPPPALATIRQYISSIKTLGNKPPTQLSGYFEASTGYNNNVNNATGQKQITVPVLLNTLFTLNSANVKTADSYLGLAAGGEAIHPISADWSLYAGMDIRNRNNLKRNNFSFITLDGQVGTSFSSKAEQIRGGLVAGQFNQSGTVNRNSNGFNVEWKHTYDGANQAVLFGQYSRYRYPSPTLATNNFNQSIAGLGWTGIFDGGRSTVSISFFGGHERDTNLRIDGGKRIYGMRLSEQTSIGERLNLFAAGGVQRGMYNRANSAFLVIRDDQQTDFTAGLIYRYTQNWAIRPQISLIRNQSNIIINRYDQADVSFTLQRDFR